MFGVGNRHGMCIVLSSPSGAGKTTISRLLLEKDADVTMSISCTTREPRANEINGRDYHFISKERFKSMVNNNEFLEYAEVFGNFYGTPRSYVEEQLSHSRDVVFDIDWQGTRQLAGKMQGRMVSVFILPPTLEELEKRLRHRALDSEDVVKKRMEKAAREISHWDEYDYVVVNSKLEDALNSVEGIVSAERLKRIRYPEMQNFVQNLLFGN